MSNRLPEFIDPLQLVEKCQGFKGTIAIAKMKRLASLLVDTAGVAELDIQFGRDSAGLATAIGTVTAVVRLQCQRCLEPMDFKVESRFSLGVVASHTEARNLPENYEPLLAEQGHLSLTELVEDEILLALPATAMHSERCSIRDSAHIAQGDAIVAKPHEIESLYNSRTAEQPNATDEDKQNPFAVLADLKEKLSK